MEQQRQWEEELLKRIYQKLSWVTDEVRFPHLR